MKYKHTKLTHSPTCVIADSHPKRSRKRRRGRRRHPPSSQPSAAGKSFHSPGPTPTGSCSPGPSTSTESSLHSPAENLINLDDVPQPTSGQSMEGLMATLNLH